MLPRDDPAAVRMMAEALLNSENKKLKNVEQFFPGPFAQIPEGVYPFRPSNRYCIRTPDGVVEVRAGDWIIQTEEKEFYYLRFEGAE